VTHHGSFHSPPARTKGGADTFTLPHDRPRFRASKLKSCASVPQNGSARVVGVADRRARIVVLGAAPAQTTQKAGQARDLQFVRRARILPQDWRAPYRPKPRKRPVPERRAAASRHDRAQPGSPAAGRPVTAGVPLAPPACTKGGETFTRHDGAAPVGRRPPGRPPAQACHLLSRRSAMC
jgi:hypothetical protein